MIFIAAMTLEQISPFNSFMENLTSRINSSKTNSIMCTDPHNSSNMAVEMIYPHTEVSFVIPQNRLSEENERSICTNIPSQMFIREDQSNTICNTNVHKNMKEYESNITPTNTYIHEAGSFQDSPRMLTPREVFQHNNLIGWNQWSIYKGNVYDSVKLKETFSHLIVTARETKTAKRLERKKENEAKEEHVNFDGSDTDDSSFDADDLEDTHFDNFYSNRSYINGARLEDMALWSKNWIQFLLKKELHKTEIQDHVSSCYVGTLVQHTDARYWDDLRSDIKVVLNDLIREDCQGTLSAHKTDYMNLLQRWMKKYRNQDPEYLRRPQSDPNLSPFPLPEGIEENPSCLRPWIETWERFDLDLPENGAWDVSELDNTDIGNSHEIFTSSLKSHIDLTPLDTTVNGEAAWDVIQEHLFARDAMTDRQKVVEQQRKGRTDFFNPQKMKNRRHDLLQYFIDKHKYDEANVKRFLNWATEMKRGENRFTNLCEDL